LSVKAKLAPMNLPTSRQTLIVGGGIGGLAAALACSRAGSRVALFERTPAFAEVGAGVQLGPNVTRVLHGWGLQAAMARVAAFPERLQVRNAVSGAELGVLRLGDAAVARYGAPYVTVHRADLHSVLLAAVHENPLVELHLNHTVQGFQQQADLVRLNLCNGLGALSERTGDVLVGADGLWSQVRQQLLGDGAPVATGHLAYRGLVRQSSLPVHLRSQQVTAWLGPRLHVVQYPVRGGEWLNVVAIVHGQMNGPAENWDHSANASDLMAHLAATCAPLQDLVQAMPDWRLWALNIRPPMRNALEQARGRVALLGDAAHPMLPYLAQGAGMALEDAHEIGVALAQATDPRRDMSALLARYAVKRWQRNARVQARAIRNGEIFHATGWLRWGRDVSLKLLGERLLDMPWLYAKG
jgi:salicylate hydroxylase